MTLKTALFTVCSYLKKYDTTFAPVHVIYSKVSEIKKKSLPKSAIGLCGLVSGQWLLMFQLYMEMLWETLKNYPNFLKTWSKQWFALFLLVEII